MNETNIEWTGKTDNAATGCRKVSPGCKNCYMFRTAKRLQRMGNPRYTSGAVPTLHWDKVDSLLHHSTPSVVFDGSMTDYFQEDIPDEFIRRRFEANAKAKQHFIQVLTKRSARLAELGPTLPWAPHMCMGVSVESADYLNRIDDLRASGALTMFVSFEPLLGPIGEVDLTGIDQIIVGGETGPRGKARVIRIEWVRELRDQALAQGVAFHFKQWGNHDAEGCYMAKRRAGRLLDGREWNQMPLEYYRHFGLQPDY
jgi:protein gp37